MEAKRWQQGSSVMTEQYLNGSDGPGSGGVEIGSVQIRLKLLPLSGMKPHPLMGLKKVFLEKKKRMMSRLSNTFINLDMVFWIRIRKSFHYILS